MKMVTAFMLGIFIAAGMPRSRRFLARPRNFVLVCVLVAASFYSLGIAG